MRRPLRILALLLVVVLAAAAAAIAWGRTQLRGSLPPLDGERRVAGLAAPVEIARDRLGIPTVRTRSRRRSAAPSSAPRRHASNTRRAALAPCAAVTSRKDGPGSGVSRPTPRAVHACPTRSRSSRTVVRPAFAHT